MAKKPSSMLPLIIFGSMLILTSALEAVHDLEAYESVAKEHKVQSVAAGSSGKYGYPFRIAPTLTPVIQSRSDDDENEAVLVAVPVAKSYGSRISAEEEDEAPLKKGHLKKSKLPVATRRQDGEDVTVQKRFRSYKEPKYRNFDELEDDFRPRRRIDVNYPYSQYEYAKPKPAVSPIDPYLTPSAEPGDSFYPVPKVKTYPPSSYGPSHSGPSYGAGKYDEPANYHGSYGGPSSSYTSGGGPSSSYTSGGGPSSSYTSGGGPSSSYTSGGGPSSSYTSGGGPSSSYTSSGGPSSGYTSSGGPSSSYTSSGGPPSSYPSSGGPSSSYSGGGQYDYHENYAVKSNEPIIGSIRKKLLDYAGATDLYDGEPDYLRQVARNKHKYGNLGNDYYSYGGPVHRESYRDFPYVETKISLIKKSRN